MDSRNDETVGLVSVTTGRRGILDPRGPYMNWIALFLMCFLSFGMKIELRIFTFEFVCLTF